MKRQWKRRLWAGLRGLGTVGAAAAVAFLILLVVFRFAPLPATPLMGLRLLEGEGIDKRWRPLAEIPSHVSRAVLAAEDQRFCLHEGVDQVQLRAAIEDWRAGGRLRGASTLSMQTTKNVFLWPSRSWIRKALELPLTPVMEQVWGKRRVIEVYLNVAEWGPGVYGIDAAARHHFGVELSHLTKRQAATLAAILPAPRSRSARRPSDLTQRRTRRILRELSLVDVSCIEGRPSRAAP